MMDRNREARRAGAMVNGLPRRRHRTTTTGGGSLRGSPEDDGPPPELQDTAARLRDRAVKKDSDIRDRDRDRDQDRERTSRSKRRRGDKYSIREDGGGGIDESSEESVNDEDEEEDDVSDPVRYVPPLTPVPMTSSSRARPLISDPKTYPLPTWKVPDEMIGVSIPRKARSSSTKRGHDWISGGGEQFPRQPSSPVQSTMTAAVVASPSRSPAPMSPPSCNISIKKRIVKQKPPKYCLKSSSPPTQDDIEIEVAEVLFGLKRQSHAPTSMHGTTAILHDSSVKFDSREFNTNKSTGDSKSRVSSLIPAPPHNSTTHLFTIAPKRKRPRPYLDENPYPAGFCARSGPILPNPDQAMKLEAPSPIIENTVGSSMDNSHDATSESAPNGMVSDSTKPPVFQADIKSLRPSAVEESGGATKLEENSSPPKMESTTSTSTSLKINPSVVDKENHTGEQLEIDLMAPPRPSSVVGEHGGGDEKAMVMNGQAKVKPNNEEDERRLRLNVPSSFAETEPVVDSVANSNKSKSKAVVVPEVQSESECGSHIQKQLLPQPPPPCSQSGFDLQFGFEKTKAINPFSSALANDHKLQLRAKDEPNFDKTVVGQSTSVPLPMSVAAGWHGGLGPMGYVAPLQGVVPMDGSTLVSPPIQATAPPFVFTQPKPKRCGTHSYIAQCVSIHQQMVKMNPYWPAAAATAPMFGAAKPYNLNMVSTPDLHAAQDKTQPFALFPSQPASKDKSPLPSLTTSDPNNAHKKQQQQQFLLPHSLPPGAPTNMMHAPAFFFPFGQQQAVAASGRPSSTKSPTTTGSNGASTTTTSTSAAIATSSGPTMSFSYPNMSGGNEAQFMAILGNNPYPFPVPAHVGVAPPYRGTHPQAAMSFFNGSFYSSQMLHPSQSGTPQSMQIQQLQQQQHQNHQNPSISTASSSSQKPQQQQRSQGGGGTSNPSWQNFQPPKGRPSQPHYDMGVGGEDSPSTADSRTKPSMNVYAQNFSMPFRSSGPNALSNSNNASSNSQQQQQTQMMFAKQQQFVAATVAVSRSKTPTTTNGNVYPDHLTSSVIAGKFPNALPSFPPLVQGGGLSSQWKSPGRPNTSQGSSSPSLQPPNNGSSAPSNKNHHHQPNHTQISFGSATTNTKPQSSQAPNNNNSQGPSSPMMGGSPSTSSISKTGGGSPRTNTSASTGNKAGRNSPSPSLPSQKPSILGSGPHMTQSSNGGGGSNKHESHSQQQPQLSKQSIQQAQMFFSNPYMQASPNSNSSAGNSYYLQRHKPENQGQKTQGRSGTPVSSSSGMLSLGGPVSLSNSVISEPAKAVVANGMKGMPTHQIIPAGFPYIHAVPSAVQVKPSEQKQPPGEYQILCLIWLVSCVDNLGFLFWKFFLATLVGKAIIKTYMQTVFIISIFNNELLDWVENELIWVLSHVPGVASVLPHLIAKLHAVKDKYIATATPISPKTLQVKKRGLSFATIWSTVVWLVLVNFLSKILNSTAQSFLKKELIPAFTTKLG